MIHKTWRKSEEMEAKSDKKNFRRRVFIAVITGLFVIIAASIPLIINLKPAPTRGPAPTKVWIFEDDFVSDDSAIDTSKWRVEGNGFYVKEGRLHISLSNSGQDFIGQGVELLGNYRFSAIETRWVILSGTAGGLLSFSTSCGDSVHSLFFELHPMNNAYGRYETRGGDIKLSWDSLPDSSDRSYVIVGKYIGEKFRVWINDIEMKETYTCKSISEWLIIGAGAMPGNNIEGYFEYVKIGTAVE